MTSRSIQRRDALEAVELMERTGLSIAKLAERLEWAERNLYYYRRGKPMPAHIRLALERLADHVQ